MNEGRFSLTVEGIEKALRFSETAESRAAYIESLRKRVAAFERRRQLPSELLRDLLRSGELKETVDTVKWAFAVEALEEIEKAGPGPAAS